MSGIIHKVKDALTGEKNTPEAEAANLGKNGKKNSSHFITLKPC